jgi:hypothetical protein
MLLALVIVFACYYVLAFVSMVLQSRDGIPNKPGFPIFGVSPLRLPSWWRNLCRSYRISVTDDLPVYGRTFRAFIPGFSFRDQCVLVTSDAETMRDIFALKLLNFDRSEREQRMLEDFLGGGLILSSNGEEWKRKRLIAEAAFHRYIRCVCAESRARMVMSLKVGNQALRASSD